MFSVQSLSIQYSISCNCSWCFSSDAILSSCNFWLQYSASCGLSLYNSSSEIIRNDKHVHYALTLSSGWILLGQNSTIHSAKFFTFCLILSPVVILFLLCFFLKEFTYHPWIRYVNTIVLFFSPVYHVFTLGSFCLYPSYYFIIFC